MNKSIHRGFLESCLKFAQKANFAVNSIKVFDGRNPVVTFCPFSRLIEKRVSKKGQEELNIAMGTFSKAKQKNNIKIQYNTADYTAEGPCNTTLKETWKNTNHSW